jgi:hypothetical protein
VWGLAALLSDLELRLGLSSDEAPAALREQCWAVRLDAALSGGRFYTRSHAVDRLGTAAALLAWRDGLLDAGWDGSPVPDGGPRLDALAELEAGAAPVPPGRADRLARVDRELAARPCRIYDDVALADAEALWPARWRRVLASLRRGGTEVGPLEPPVVERAPASTDLGRLQASILGDAVAEPQVAGDGSLVLLRAPTSHELAEALAAFLRAEARPATVIIRGGEHAALDAALAGQGLATLGSSAASPHRPALQVLSLAIELAFEPRDPYRVLELLTLPIGPLQGLVGWSLARAIVQAPGIGGPGWRAAKEWLEEQVAARSADPKAAARRIARIAEWLERPGTPRGERAPRANLLAVAVRVEEWLRGRIGRAKDDAVLAVAYAQAREFRGALAADARDALSLVEARALADRVTAAGLATRLAEERAGRIDHVDEPGALLVSRADVVFWHAVAGTERRVAASPLREDERAALSSAGVILPDLDRLLEDEGRAWRRAVLAARRRLILAIPDTSAGTPSRAHPLWDEIVGRLDASDEALSRLTSTARQLRAGRVPVAALCRPALPEARPTWQLPAGAIPRALRHSATSLDALLRCPLRGVLQGAAHLSSGAVAALPGDPVIAGNLGHRLVQRLHELDLLATDRETLERRARELLSELLPEQGAPWLLPGRAFDREQYTEILVRAALDLGRGLSVSRMTSVDVEREIALPWNDRELVGRIDLLVNDARGRPVVIDLKWGGSSHARRLQSGTALQLALYARAAGATSAAYFALKTARFLAVEDGLFTGVRPLDGPSMAETWDRVERTVTAVDAALAEGRVPVTGVSRSPGLMAELRIPEPERDRHFGQSDSPCDYCALGAICGRRWEDLR